MVILNVTIKVDWSIAESWLQWQQDIHVPEILGTGCFEKHQFVKLLQVDNDEGPTYALQLYARSLGNIEQYQQLYEQDFQQVIGQKWGDKYVDFRTIMEVIE